MTSHTVLSEGLDQTRVSPRVSSNNSTD